MVEGFQYQDAAHYYNRLIRENSTVITKREKNDSKGILLDLACGTGTLSVLLADLGWDVIGVDSSSGMLSCAKQHEKVSYICQDMTELDLYGTVDAAVCCFDALNHLLDEQDLLDTFKRVSLFMNPGGVFVFDVNTVYCHETVFADNIFVSETDGIYCVWRHEKQDDDIMFVSLSVFEKQENGLYKRHDETNIERAYSLKLISKLCEKSGFKVAGCYDFLTENKARENNNRVVFVCKKAV